MHKLLLSVLVSLMFAGNIFANDYSVYVDKKGVLRRSDNKEEVAYFGVNYTVPFAHAYRALGYLGIDRKEAIDRDVYHMARLGFNAFRIHLWDVELSDSEGNLQDNDHLDLLDYLIYKLEQRNISIVVTAQTNFGNGYPERNIPTGGYSYNFNKCEIHDNPDAIAIQQRYLKSLVAHKNPYTGKSYASDNAIIALEINNEPCHSGNADAARKYVDGMVKTLRKAGFAKPVLYNVSHNYHCTQGFFDSAINGTTYQWYPIGLVAGHERKGNFLPYVDNYKIPFASVRNFNKKAKFIYEFDPADNLYSYLYPAIARSFRTAGFQWATQFAYDPIDMAWANTEYQTHFLNLAYTPQKALSMKIAAEATRKIDRGADFGKYPNDTIFGDFRVSYNQNLSEYNSSDKFFYSNTTTTAPKSVDELKEIAGCGNSPIVAYNGSGAYFLDKLDDSTWRLEVMPDVVLVADPFEKPSLKKAVGSVFYNDRTIDLKFGKFKDGFFYKGINSGNSRSGQSHDGKFTVYPGVYLLSTSNSSFNGWNADSEYQTIKIGEYTAPAEKLQLAVAHTPQTTIEAGHDLEIKATVASSQPVDSVVIYPSDISFWSESNPLYRMDCSNGTDYSVKINIGDQGKKDFRYNIVVFSAGCATTYPQCENTTPLDWDYASRDYYTVRVIEPGSPIALLEAKEDYDKMDLMALPDGQLLKSHYNHNQPVATDSYDLSIKPSTDTAVIVLKKYIGDIISPIRNSISNKQLKLAISGASGIGKIEMGIIDTDGVAYSCSKTISEGDKSATALISEMKPMAAYQCPIPFPSFLTGKVSVESNGKPKTGNAEMLYIVLKDIPANKESGIRIHGAWLE